MNLIIINGRELRIQAIYKLEESGEMRVIIHVTPDNSADVKGHQNNLEYLLRNEVNVS